MGLTAEVSVGGVADLAGNIAQGSAVWSFTVADFEVSVASVRVAGFTLNALSTTVDTAALAAIKTDLASLLGVADTRITNLQATPVVVGGVSMTGLELTITASASKSATLLAQQLAQAVQNLAPGSNAASSYSSALKDAVASQVCLVMC